MKRGAWLIALAPFLLACGQRPSATGVSAPPAGVRRLDVSDSLAMSVLMLDPSWPPKVRITFANRGLNPIWLSGRFLVGDRGGLFKELWFDVVGGESRADSVSCRGGAGHAKASDYVLLPPDAEVSHVVVLPCLPLSGTGPWEVIAHYRDKNAQPPQPPSGAWWFAGELASAPFHIARP